MPTLLHADGFEFQLFNTNAFAAGGTATYTTVTNAAPDTSIFRTGAASLAVSPTGAAAGQVQKTIAAGSRTGVASFYIYFPTSLPASDALIAHVGGPTATTARPQMYFHQATSKLALAYGSNLTNVSDFGAAISANTWYLVDWKVDISGTTFTQTAQLDGANSATPTKSAQTATDITLFALGSTSTTGPAITINYDDWVFGVTLADYPLGAHSVALLKPTSDGTHNAGTNVIEANGGADIDGSTTTAFNLIDEVPPENADYIQQSATGSGNYAEVVFASPPAGTKWGTTYWCAIEGAAANGSDMLLRVVDSGGSTLLDQGGAGAVSGTTRRYSVGYLAGDPTGNKGRVGFATDVSPVPRALTFVAQVAYVPSAAATDFVGMIPL